MQGAAPASLPALPDEDEERKKVEKKRKSEALMDKAAAILSEPEKQKVSADSSLPHTYRYLHS
jgi:hypothetical protein